MKLITEHSHEIRPLIESTKEGKNYYIEGVFMVSEERNRNNRIYEKRVLERAVDEYNKTQVKEGRAVGELNHPETPTINYKEVSHKILKLEWQGNKVIGKALVLNTPNGQIVKGLLEGGVVIGVSSRGMGTVKSIRNENYVQDDFVLSTIDIVQDPSAPGAFVNGIMEGVDWYKDAKGIFRARRTNSAAGRIDEARILENLNKFLSDLA